MIQATVTTAPYLVTRRTVNNDYDLIARKTQMDNILLIPGLDRPNPNNLFRDGQVGGWLDPYDLTKMWVDNAGTTPMTASDLGVGIGRIQSKGGPVITFEQATSGDRPVWGRHPVSGLRQLLVNTAFSGTVPGTPGTRPTSWNEGAVTGSISSYDATTGSIGFSGNGGRRWIQLPLTVPVNSSVCVSTEITVTTADVFASFFLNSTDSVTGSSRVLRLNGSVVTGGTTVPVGTHVLEYVLTTTSTEWTSDVRLGVGVRTGVDTNAVAVFRRPQAEFGTARSTFQSATNRFDITETGQPDLYYFSCNGVNQSWSSNATVDFSGTNKVTVWAGLRKLSDAATGIVCELSAIVSNPGTFALTAPSSVGANSYRFSSTGTSSASAGTGVFAAAPDSAVILGESKISTDLCRISRNGTLVESVSDDQGTGNYSNATLHIGRRGGSSLPFNGYIYSLIIAGDNYDTRTIQQFSDWSLKPRRLITA